MLFNSIEYTIFLPIVFFLYWFIVNKKLHYQNLFLVAASYLFYGWWDWRFLFLIILSSVVDYSIGILISNSIDKVLRKVYLTISLIINLGLLGYFKYCNFFIESFLDAFSIMGKPVDSQLLNIILPVGISFYTFQTLSYTIDVYNKKIECSKNIIAFFSFVSFFPQLVAGPIERASNLLPQFSRERKFNPVLATDGMRQILWGFFKKIVVADNCAIYANEIFNNSGDYNGSTLIIGAIFFSFQIYCDFSGYSDIAIGTARLLGLELKQNFAFPYFSRDIGEFWRRWHISLSTWFRDYLYIPLGGSKGGTLNKIKNTFIIFIVSGFWHGANWTFVIWGFLNAIYFLPLLLSGSNRKHLDTIAENRYLPNLKEVINVTITFGLITFAWIFFRAEDLNHAISYVSTIFSPSVFSVPYFKDGTLAVGTILSVGFLLIIEWIGRSQKHALEAYDHLPKYLEYLIFFLIAVLILENYNLATSQEFIYFDF